MEMEDNPVLDLLVASTFRRDLLRLIEKYEKLAKDYDRFLEAYRTEAYLSLAFAVSSLTVC
jgi:hypothetical protein